MKIEGPGNTGKTGSAKKAKRAGGASGAGFAQSLKGGADAASEESAAVSGGGPASVSSIDLILAIQGVGDATEDEGGRRQPVEWGRDLLDRLDAIRLGLLAGRISPDRLEALGEALARERGKTDDPELGRLLKDIELRARVELAKFRQR
ncbi:hypothetical protein KAJ83_08120 [Marivibrio halodurans]|uniref:Flagellar assembly protein FliX n=2 Tax=Marivibrio halodurans TaxID=2039722 RepID=A0A8J7SMI2_9PROT|nr:hypothetical protein [Marivibrio halodurans]